jgi:DUF4097 and DUF4098 domain-containing protein YvlB
MMKDERMEILKMVADKMISVEEGERLLQALEKGDEEARARRYDRCGPGHRHHGDWDLGERLGEMGFRMQEFFDNAFGSMFGDEYWFEGYEAVKGRAEDLTFDADSTLVISNPRHVYRSGSGDIRVSPAPDDRLHVSSADRGRFEILRKDGKILILCQADTSIQVPRSLSRLKLVLAKGSTRIDGLAGALEIRSMKGDISVTEASQPVVIRSMSGNIHLDLADAYAGKTEVSSMHGDVEVATAPDFSGRVEARTARGHIRIRAQGVKSTASKNAFFRQETTEIGAGDARNLLSLKTMNGDITVGPREVRS